MAPEPCLLGTGVSKAPRPHLLLVSAPGKHPQTRPQACGDDGSEASRSQVLDKMSPIWSPRA